MWDIHYTQTAKRDLEEIYRYIAVQLSVPETAAALFEDIIEAVSGLSQMPHRFRLWEGEPWHTMGLRRLVVGNYVVLYLPDEGTKSVSIVRIMYQGRDINAQLSETFPEYEEP